MADETLSRTPLYAEHVRLGAKLVPFAGWEMPIQYKGIAAEHTAVRERVGLFDVSHMGELHVTGPGALAAVDSLITNDLSKAEDGQAVYTCCCNAQGTILDDLIVYRRAADDVLVVCNASNRPKIAAHFREALAGRVEYRDESDETALIAVQGPRALELLRLAGSSLDPSQLKSFRFADGKIADVKVTIARTGYTGEDGVELFCPSAGAARLFGALLDAGAPLGVEPIGLGARDTLRLEARLSLYGNEIDETTNPLEAGLGWVVKLDKPGGFLGRDALAKVKADGITRTIVGFEMVGRGIARHGYPLLEQGGAIVGLCTSGGPSPTLGKSIGLGYLPIGLSAIGTSFLVDCRGKSIEAKVVKPPFYKRKPSAGTA
ncbi:MAG TPA: glycine cleavage system aminomethyltransferase GcvT [Polyangiaceae bacterium]|nr:glycine cleavage system aminomethyltransferase GcvT [Polyangiaceae bacterium]